MKIFPDDVARVVARIDGTYVIKWTDEEDGPLSGYHVCGLELDPHNAFDIAEVAAWAAEHPDHVDAETQSGIDAAALSRRVLDLCQLADAKMQAVLSHGFTLDLAEGTKRFSATADHQLDANGILTEIALGAPPDWPYPWPDADDATAHFASETEFMAFVAAFRSLKQSVSESVGVVKAEIRAAETTHSADQSFAAWLATWE